MYHMTSYNEHWKRFAGTVESNLTRRTSVRFKFSKMPGQSDFLNALQRELPKGSIRCVQLLPGGTVDVTLSKESLVSGLLHEGIEIAGAKIRPQPLGLLTDTLKG